MKSKIFLLLFVASIIFFIGYAKPVFYESRIDNVVKVFWHGNDRYSLMIQDPNFAEIVIITFSKSFCSGMGGRAHVFRDVSVDSSMWAYLKIKLSGEFPDLYSCIEILNIHVRSELDTESSIWNNEKLGIGQTAVLY